MTTGHVYQAPPCGGRSKQQAPPSDYVRYVVKPGQEYNRGQEGVAWPRMQRAWLDLERNIQLINIHII